MRNLVFLFFWFFGFFINAQQADINSCLGAIQIDKNTEFNIPFKGFKGLDRSGLNKYIGKPTSKNSVWFVYESFDNGKLAFNCRLYLDSFDIVVLKTNSSSSCKDIEDGSALPVLIRPNTSCDEMKNAYINVEVGYTYFFVFHSKEKDESNIYLDFVFEKDNTNIPNAVDPLVLNLVYNNENSVFCFIILDEENLNPVPSRISISNTGELDGTYLASNLFINVSRSVKNGSIKVDAEGYLSKDVDQYKIKTVKRGQVAKLDRIYFEAGSSNILDESLPKIRRLRDFLVLNSSVKIEIQGHVNIDGSERSAKKLSKKRAKEILKFLVYNGIAKSRLSSQGFGYSKPVFQNPSNEEEKEANRRVEILIK